MGARAPAEVVDLLVLISKPRIASPARAKIFLTECPCGGNSQRNYGHRKQGNRREPKLRRLKHRFSHKRRAPKRPKVHAFAWVFYCGGKANPRLVFSRGILVVLFAGGVALLD
jgi:hypothetical protein